MNLTLLTSIQNIYYQQPFQIYAPLNANFPITNASTQPKITYLARYSDKDIYKIKFDKLSETVEISVQIGTETFKRIVYVSDIELNPIQLTNIQYSKGTSLCYQNYWCDSQSDAMMNQIVQQQAKIAIQSQNTFQKRQQLNAIDFDQQWKKIQDIQFLAAEIAYCMSCQLKLETLNNEVQISKQSADILINQIQQVFKISAQQAEELSLSLLSAYNDFNWFPFIASASDFDQSRQAQKTFKYKQNGIRIDKLIDTIIKSNYFFKNYQNEKKKGLSDLEISMICIGSILGASLLVGCSILVYKKKPCAKKGYQTIEAPEV
ncbi:Conserved_hypothetical protein [Hexamita inflata]|uniref:Transmembrane protein n=1 Tax=Hexamita inflata TaxID=28002 RepID=A0AA86PG73_9EUKA|nr:Conserved hypothetical protein [Hexamita inflata]